MDWHKATREKYGFLDIRQSAEGEPLARFAVELATGKAYEELLRFPVIESRIRLWEEAVQQTPALTWQDVQGFHNYRQYVRALVEALKLQVV